MTTQDPAQPKNSLAFIQRLPKAHMAAVGAAVTLMFFALLLPSERVEANRTAMPLPLELEPLTQIPSAEEMLSALQQDDAAADTVSDVDASDTAAVATEVFDASWQEVTVRSGDSLSKLFQRAGLSAADLHEVMQSGPEAKTLTRIFPGQKLAFQLDDGGSLQSLRYEHDLLTSTQYTRAEDSFVAEKVVREPEVRRQTARGTITSSLYKAAADAGMSDGVILELAKVFGGVVDFVLDIRADDEFMVLYEEYWLGDRKVRNGEILAASFTNRGKSYVAYRYEDSDGHVSYYSPEGESMKRAFLRAPLDFLRVTSNFNPKRMHPVLKVARPHRGIDYGAPAGTPVYAAGDGRIAQSGFTKPNGNFIVIQHGQQYTTKYLHLQKRAVRAGERVRQGQLIGWVGSTGYSTGPHLHYEFLVNGVHKDPSKIVHQLPQATQLAGAEQQRFLAQVSNIKNEFAMLEQQVKLAANKTTPNKG